MIRYSDHANDRLIWISQTANEDFWDAQWEQENDIELKARHAQGMVRVTKKHLAPPSAHRIIEGGCGNGGIVLALQRAGYDVLGIDYAEKTVAHLNKTQPSLSIEKGDVRNLSNIADASFDGYWSLGVIEHFWDGYTPILQEAQRVLKPGGYLFLTFPWYSPIRRLKAALHIIKNFHKNSAHGLAETEPEQFYQFCLNQKTVAADLQRLGFTVTEHYARSGLYGLDVEWPWTNRIRKIIAGILKGRRPRNDQTGNEDYQAPQPEPVLSHKERLGEALDKVLAPLFGHGYIIVARKNQD